MTPASPPRVRRRAPDLTLRFLADRRRSLFVWAASLAAYALFMVAFFPSIRDSPSFATALEDYPDALKEIFGGEAGFDLTSGPGFIGTELYYLAIPILLAVVAIGQGASLGADQESGLVDLILANPLTRRRVVLERALAMAAAVVVLTASVSVVVAIGDPIVGLDIGLGNLLATSMATAALALLHGFVALAVAGATGRRGVAIGAATAVFAAGYLINVAAGLVDSLGWAKPLSPYHHATGASPLATGWDGSGLAVLVVVGVAVLVAAVALFERRDLT